MALLDQPHDSAIGTVQRVLFGLEYCSRIAVRKLVKTNICVDTSAPEISMINKIFQVIIKVKNFL